MKFRAAAIVGSIAFIALTGCTKQEPIVTAQPAATVSTALSTSVAPSPTTTAAASSSTAETTISAPSEAQPIGAKQTVTLGEIKIDVTAYALQDVPRGEYSILPAGASNTGLDVEVCANYAGPVSSERWTLIDSTNGRYKPEIMVIDELTPKYPYSSETLAAGECIRGWIMFETRDDRPVTTIRYETGDGSVILKWTV